MPKKQRKTGSYPDEITTGHIYARQQIRTQDDF